MKRLSIAIVLVSWLVLVGYMTVRSMPAASPEAADPTVTPLIPGPFPTPRVPPDKTYYRKRCWPACHYDAAWISEEPPRSTLDFEGSLGPGWVWINEDATHWTLAEVPGALRIVSEPGSAVGADGLESGKNVVVREAPSGHFDLVTRVSFDPRGEFQEAAIVTEMDDGSVISLGRGACAEEDSPPCVGDGVYFDARGMGCERSGVQTSAETVNLMLRRAGSSYLGYYSLGDNVAPEADWVEVGRCYSSEVSPTRAGLAVSDGAGAPDLSGVPADFDFFTIVERK